MTAYFYPPGVCKNVAQPLNALIIKGLRAILTLISYTFCHIV